MAQPTLTTRGRTRSTGPIAAPGLDSAGPTTWKSGTQSVVQESSSAVRQAIRNVQLARCHDPLPGLRDLAAVLSNQAAHVHFRKTRTVVQRLRDVTIDTNTEVRALTRVKDAVQKALAVIDRDLKVNADSQAARQQRPAREKAADSADGLLQVERQHLNSIKKSLQVELGIIQQQLKALDAARRRLAEVTRERARVLDLVTHDSPAAHIDASTDQLDSDDTAGEVVDPLGAWTPEVEAALTEAQEAIGASSDLRLAAGRLLDTVNEMERTVTKAVNAGLTQKIVETSSLKHQLKSAADENRQATSKVQRLFNETELTWNQLRGPLTSEHLELRERLDRPVVKVVQRHPGNQMPEAQHIVAGSDALLGSLQCSGLTLGRLKLSQLRISDDASSKSAAIDVDSRVVRMRKRQATMYCM